MDFKGEEIDVTYEDGTSDIGIINVDDKEKFGITKLYQSESRFNGT